MTKPIKVREVEVVRVDQPLSWQEQFDKEIMCGCQGEGIERTHTTSNPERIRAFIQSLLDQQKKEILEKLRLEKTGDKDTYEEPGHCYQCDFIDGYNQAVSDLEELKKSL
jgi:hypothetical protein